MFRFSKLQKYELLEVQNIIEDIYHFKKNDYISDLHDKEIEEIKYYEKLFEDVVKDFEKLGI